MHATKGVVPFTLCVGEEERAAEEGRVLVYDRTDDEREISIYLCDFY
jgi:hypothetical protein